MASKTILVVDDEQPFRDMMKVMLKEDGYEILEADNGLSAFELAKSDVPDLIISDIMMYNGSGFILREFLKQEPLTESIPLILMTGAAQDAGAWGSDLNIEYLLKPFSREVLIMTVKRVMNARSHKGNLSKP
ncbi:MAG: response regulator [Bacteroidota bacterium]